LLIFRNIGSPDVPISTTIEIKKIADQIFERKNEAPIAQRGIPLSGIKA
jgi:hypothetical protein